MYKCRWVGRSGAARVGSVRLLLGPSLLLTACATPQAPQHPVVLVYLRSEALGACVHPMLINHGPDPVLLEQSQVPVGGTSEVLVSPASDTLRIMVDHASYARASSPYPFDLGFRCSDEAPEFRQPYPLYSELTFTMDPTVPSGLKVEVKQLYLPD